MNYNEFDTNSFTTNDINSIPVSSGHNWLDTFYEKPWEEAKNKVAFHDDTLFNKDVLNSELEYIPDAPQDYLVYDDIKKDKYYWDTKHYEMFYFYITDEVNPWDEVKGTFKPVDGLPPNVVNIYIEFDETAAYFNKNEVTTDIYRWSKEKNWYIDGTMYNLEVPVGDFQYDIDLLDKEIYYFDNSVSRAYFFNYFKYFRKIDVDVDIYERMFEFYKRLHDNFIDVNNNDRFNHKDYIYISKSPEKVIKEPATGAVYYNSKSNKMYLWNGTKFEEIEQDNLMIPHITYY